MQQSSRRQPEILLYKSKKYKKLCFCRETAWRSVSYKIFLSQFYIATDNDNLWNCTKSVAVYDSEDQVRHSQSATGSGYMRWQRVSCDLNAGKQLKSTLCVSKNGANFGILFRVISVALFKGKVKVNRQGKLNMRIIFQSVLTLLTTKYQIRGSRLYSLPKLARFFLRHSMGFSVRLREHLLLFFLGPKLP